MKIDDELCLCFHVSWRKVINFIRIHRPQRPSQVAECQGAGTGCGWCRKAMTRLLTKIEQGAPDIDHLQEWLDNEYPNPLTYVDGRKSYIASGKGQPPV